VKESIMLRTSSYYLFISAMVFAAVAIAHLLRALNTLPVTFGNWPVPVWVSWLVAIVTAALSTWALSLLRRRD